MVCPLSHRSVPRASAGLVVIMIGAVVVTVATTGVAPALMPMVVGCLAAFVAYGRSRLAPIQRRNLLNVFASRTASRGRSVSSSRCRRSYASSKLTS